MTAATFLHRAFKIGDSKDLVLNGQKITGLAAATANGDALRYEQIVGLYLALTGGTLSGSLAMGGQKITGLAAGTNNGDAVRFEQLSVIPTLCISGSYTGDGTANRAVAHGLGSIPKIVILHSNSSGVGIGVNMRGNILKFVGTTTAGQFVVTTTDSTNFYVGSAGDYPNSFNNSGALHSFTVIG
jgi:hypothetical protein